MARRPRVAPSSPPAPPVVPEDLTTWRRVNRVQLGELMGVHPDTVTDRVRQGMPIITAGGAGREGVYDAVECLAWQRQREGKNATEAAKTRALAASAELNELKLQQQRGELLPRTQVILEGQAYTKAWAAQVQNLAPRLEQAGLIRREDLAGVQALLREVLTEIANWKTPADLAAAAAAGAPAA